MMTIVSDMDEPRTPQWPAGEERAALRLHANGVPVPGNRDKADRLVVAPASPRRSGRRILISDAGASRPSACRGSPARRRGLSRRFSEPDLLGKLGPGARIIRRNHRIVLRQTPFRPILVGRHTVGAHQM